MPRHTRVPQRGARGATSYHISMDFMPILTPRGAAKYWNKEVRAQGAVRQKWLKNTGLECTNGSEYVFTSLCFNLIRRNETNYKLELSFQQNLLVSKSDHNSLSNNMRDIFKCTEEAA